MFEFSIGRNDKVVNGISINDEDIQNLKNGKIIIIEQRRANGFVLLYNKTEEQVRVLCDQILEL